ncbi:hypothetical protein P154DRAFT_468928, partial [Amniculicola lignicola CBS 123094]
MDIPRGHAKLPLTDHDFLDFIWNYFKAEYSPIRSFWSTATAEPHQSQRWITMGRELVPTTFRPANAQAQKDLESLDLFVRRRKLDAGFIRGLVVRYAKYEVHERLEKKLYESARLDLMVRKALKEKHVIDALWPSPAPKAISKPLLEQGVSVRSWYGDMFAKYFKGLYSVDDFLLRPEVDQYIKSTGTLMLVPFIDHLVFGDVEPIVPIVSKGAGFANSGQWKKKEVGTFGEPDKFEVRFDAEANVGETYKKSVVRQCQCLKCGSKRDVTVVISVDPYPGPVSRTVPSSSSRKMGDPKMPPRKHNSKAAQRYKPSTSPAEQKKQCPRCTFLNHADLAACEICAADLPPSAIVAKPPSPVLKKTPTTTSHSHSESLPPPTTHSNSHNKGLADLRPSALNRHSLSSTLFSIFPFSQEHQSEHHANLPATQPIQPPETTEPPTPQPPPQPKPKPRPTPKGKQQERPRTHTEEKPQKHNPEQPPNPNPTPNPPSTPPPNLLDADPTTPLTGAPEMTMMLLTPLPASTTSDPHPRFPTGLPQNLMDDFVPVSPSFRDAEDEDAGWGEMSREEARWSGERGRGGDGDGGDGDEDEESEGDGEKVGFIDLDAVALEEKGVWGGDEE